MKDLNKVLERANMNPINFENLSPQDQIKEMNRMLYYIDQLKHRIFSSESKTFQTIFQILSSTSGRGSKTEDVAEKKFGEKFGVENVKRIGELGSKEDMMGIDLKVKVDGKEYTAQVKPFESISEIDGMYRVEGTANVKKYKTDWMVFIRRGKDVVVFDNTKSEIKDGTYNYPLDSMLYQF
jgi:hypothetical protein